MFKIQTDAIDLNKASEALADPKCGAMVTFEGWVRNHHEGEQVLHLEYEAFTPLCIKEAEVIKQETYDKYDVRHINCIHRVGFCEIGTLVVWVGVSSDHRKEAFDACEYYINQLKVRLPIWKKETYTDGTSTWVKCLACHEQGTVHKH